MEDGGGFNELINRKQIEAALTSLKQKSLGFEMRAQKVLRKFRESYPSMRALTSIYQ